MMQLPEEINNKSVKDIKFTDNTISISFNDTDCCIKLYAYAECCSRSYFEFDIDEDSFKMNLTGKNIDYIVEDNNIECEERYNEEEDACIKVTPLKIITNDNDINFKLINSSNGYYNGWLEIKSEFF